MGLSKPEGSLDGQPCSSDGTCVKGMFCRADMTCVEAGHVGAPCTTTCDEGIVCVEQVCAEPIPVGMPCTLSVECSHTCASPLQGGPEVCARKDPKPAEAPDYYEYCGAGFDACGAPRCQRECASCEEIPYYNGWVNQTFAVCN
jgi:hypothetical protein